MAAAQALGILLADRLAPSHEACWTAGAVALASALSLGPRAPRARAALVVAACLAAGAAALSARLADARAPWPPRELTVEATVAEVAWQGARLRADLEPLAPIGAHVPLPRRVRVYGERSDGVPGALQAWQPGERWRLRLRLGPLAGPRNPGRSDPVRALERRGIGALAGLSHPGLAVRMASSAGERARALWAWRARTAERLAAAGPGGALLAALALGERGELPQATLDAFSRLGLLHLLSVSGLHLSLVAGLAFALARAGLSRSAALAARRDVRRPALVLALLTAWAYAVVTGFAVPVRRSAWMVSAVALALWWRRARRPLHPLALASLCVLAREPGALLEAGFQLSFAATAMLVLGGGPAQDGGPETGAALRLLRGVAALVRTSALALLATAPLVGWHFGRVEPAGLLCNVLAIPVTTFALLPASALGVLAAGARGPLAGSALEACEAVSAAFLAAVVALSERVPAGAGVGPLPAGVAALAAGLAGAALLRPRAWVLMAALVAQALLLVRASPPPIAPLPPRLVVLDVGQGDAVLVQGRAGALLVDAGVARPDGSDLGASVVVPALRALGVERLDLVAASHADLDHRGGLLAVLRALPVARLWLPHGGAAEPAFAELVAAAGAAGARVEERGAGSAPLRVGDLSVAPLWPPPGGPAGSRNDRSLVLRVEVAGRTALLPGDLEAGAEARLLAVGAPLRADILKLGHHGSRTSSTAAWLSAVDGAVAVASAPRAGRFGMPHPEVVAGLREAGYALWWTGRDGAVLVGLGPVLQVRGWGRPAPHARPLQPVRPAGGRPPGRLPPRRGAGQGPPPSPGRGGRREPQARARSSCFRAGKSLSCRGYRIAPASHEGVIDMQGSMQGSKQGPKLGSKLGSKLVSAAAVAVLLGTTMVPAAAEAQSQGDKLKRGFANLAFGIIELPGTIIQESRASNPVQGLTVGLVKGAFRAVRRELVGAYELITFPIDTPAGMQKIVDPEYPWAYFE